MATSGVDQALWYFKSGNSWSTKPNDEWTKYRDIEIQIIEEAFRQEKTEVLLDKYRIDLKELIQFNRINSSKQRPVRRQLGCSRIECLREERFHAPHAFTSGSTYGNVVAWCPFLTKWFESPPGKRALVDFSSAIDLCINGILEEAKRHNSNSETEAQWMADQLRACKTKSRHEVSKTCIHLYTRESFLYHVLNTALRDGDYSKLDTLGPFCFLINCYSHKCTEFIGTVYRGVQLSPAIVELYRQAIGSWHTWPSYSSTTKNRKMAEFRGNTLLIIEISSSKFALKRAFDVAGVSHFPNEEEVLLPAGAYFQILSVEQDPMSQKYIIAIQI